MNLNPAIESQSTLGLSGEIFLVNISLFVFKLVLAGDWVVVI